jgi:hydrogenase nickel incorporation protein HypA/HybF
MLVTGQIGSIMHELAVTESLLEISMRHAKEAQADKITDLFIVVGQLSSIVDDSVQFYWELIAKGTPAETATLHFRRIPAEMKCLSCEQNYKPTDEVLACPKCDSTQVKVLSGDEFYLEAIDVET